MALTSIAAAVILAVVIACGESEPKHPSEVCRSDAAGGQTQNAGSLPPGGPPSFPYIFQGQFEVDGKPGPSGATMFARIGAAKSPSVSTGAGTYRNIIIGPLTTDDVDAVVEIFLGDPEQSTVKADQTFKFTTVGVPTTYDCDISFPRLP